MTADRWRSITTWGAPPAFNMGLDEALLLDPLAPPTLRFYTWSPDTLSLGYFQRHDEVPGVERAGAVVRRITGGGAIHHVGELTFSISASLDHPLYAGHVGEGYTRVHAVLARALEELGIPARRRGREAALDSELEGTGMCFHHSSCEDLVWGNRKGVGSAQRRKDGRVLHHGSIKLADSPLEVGVATARTDAGPVDAAALAARIREVFTREHGIRFETSVPTPAERERARTLGTRYLSPEFVRRR
jgi:lipoate-protein ligase A